MWTPGTKLIRENSPELGVGVVVGVEGRFIDVMFPDSGTQLRLSPDAAGIRPIELGVGHLVRTSGGEEHTIERVVGTIATLSNGRKTELAVLWPVIKPPSPFNKLASGDLDPFELIQNRLDGYELLNMRRRGLISSLLGGRVELFPHQLDTAARAIRDERVRWLLADEVGLGKTIVACMITSAMVRMGRVDKVLIVAPDTLTVQWLGELYRKFHQVFVHVDAERIECVARDFGDEANPFDIHPLAIVSFELLRDHPGALASLDAAPPEMIVVDEAHQFVSEHAGELILPLVRNTPHALLLTATPFQAGRKGFLRLVDMLALPHREHDAVQHVGHVSAVTRTDIHALGTRQPRPVDISAPGDLGPDDPRVRWILEQFPAWKAEGTRVLVFVNDAERAKKLEQTLTTLTQVRLFVFHEEMGAGERDVELARFRLSASPLLISSGAGSEGRNFQFCDILVHCDLPDDPVVLEQRIGRVDRIGRTSDIPIVYFRFQSARLAAVYERLGIFSDASVGASPALSQLRDDLRDSELSVDRLEAILEETEARIKSQAGAWVFDDSHDREDSARVLAGIPPDLDELIQRFCCESAEIIGLDFLEKDGVATYFFEYGNSVEVDAIPGLDHGARFLGTFSRQEAVQTTLLDFFANGHVLVESLLAELEDSPRGRVGAVKVSPAEVSHLKGLYLLVVESHGGVMEPRLLPLAHAGRVPVRRLNLKREGERMLGLVHAAMPLPSPQARALFRKFKGHTELRSVNPESLEMALLIVVMN